MSEPLNERILEASQENMVVFDEKVFESFKVFLNHLNDIVMQRRLHSITAIQPESWDNMMHFSRWSGRIQFEAKLSKMLDELGLSIHSNWYGFEGGIILPVFVPRSIFTSDAGIAPSHKIPEPALDSIEQKQNCEDKRK